MAAATLHTVLQRFSGYLDTPNAQNVVFTWHGGEPLLAGKEFYRRVLNWQGELFANHSGRVANLVQSNLTLLDDEFVDILLQLTGNRGIGTSYDINPEIRPLASGESYEDRWLDAIALLRRRKMKYGIGYVVHSQSLGQEKELYYFFRNLAKDVSLRCNPLYHLGRGGQDEGTRYHITAEEYGEFLIRMAQVWEDDGRSLPLLPVSEWVRHLEGDARGNLTCDSAGNCHMTHLGVAPDGTVHNCGRAHDADTLPYGNLLEDGLGAVLDARANSPLASRQQVLRSEVCGTCPLWDWCHGGCPIDAYIHTGDVMGKTVWCESRKMFAEYHTSRLEGHGRRIPARTEAREGKRRKDRSSAGTRRGSPAGQRQHQGLPPSSISIPWGLYRHFKQNAFFGRPDHEFVFRVGTLDELKNLISAKPSPAKRGNGVWLEDPHLMEYAYDLSVPILLPSRPSDYPLIETLRTIQRLPETRFRFVVDAADPAFCDDSLVFASLGHPVSITFSEPGRADFQKLLQILDYYLHSPSLMVPIQPLHSLTVGLLEKREVNLWQACEEDCRRNIYVTEKGEVTLSRRFASRGALYGSVEDGPEVWGQSDFYQRLSGLDKNLRRDVSVCSYCRHFPVCGGYFQDVLAEEDQSQCRQEIDFFSELVEAVHVLREMKAQAAER